MGSIGTALIAVTMNGESVSSSTNHPRATITMKKDTMENRDALHSNLKAAFWKALNGPLLITLPPNPLVEPKPKWEAYADHDALSTKPGVSRGQKEQAR
jgi:hypothetical protein